LLTLDDPKYVKPIVNKGAIKHYRESALMTAIHILICLIQGKSREDIAKDFDNNLESVCVWIDYMIGIDWVYRDPIDGTWVASDNGKKWIEKYDKM
jgi:hypothetical protein